MKNVLYVSTLLPFALSQTVVAQIQIDPMIRSVALPSPTVGGTGEIHRTRLLDFDADVGVDAAVLVGDDLVLSYYLELFGNYEQVAVSGVSDFAILDNPRGGYVEGPNSQPPELIGDFILAVGVGGPQAVSYGATVQILPMASWSAGWDDVRTIESATTSGGCHLLAGLDSTRTNLHLGSWSAGDPDANLTTVQLLAPTAEMVFMDWNGDGAQDVVTFEAGRANGWSVADGSPLGSVVLPSGVGATHAVRIAFDSGPVDELVCLSQDPSTLAWQLHHIANAALLQTSVLSFTPHIPTVFEIQNIAAGDQDGDGDDDLLINNVTGVNLAMIRNQGPGLGFVGSPWWAVDVGPRISGTDTVDVVFADINRDRGGVGDRNRAEILVTLESSYAVLVITELGEAIGAGDSDYPVVAAKEPILYSSGSGTLDDSMHLPLDAPPEFGFATHVEWTTWRHRDVLNSPDFEVQQHVISPVDQNDAFDMETLFDNRDPVTSLWVDWRREDVYYLTLRFVEVVETSNNYKVVLDSSPAYLFVISIHPFNAPYTSLAELSKFYVDSITGGDDFSPALPFGNNTSKWMSGIWKRELDLPPHLRRLPPASAASAGD